MTKPCCEASTWCSYIYLDLSEFLFDEHVRTLIGFLKIMQENLARFWPRAWRHCNAALNERAQTRQTTAQRARRRSVWLPCIHNEWKDRKTTQQHGQIRLSETIFKIWVRVQAVTSLSLWLHTPSSAPYSTFISSHYPIFVSSLSFGWITSPTFHIHIFIYCILSLQLWVLK